LFPLTSAQSADESGVTGVSVAAPLIYLGLWCCLLPGPLFLGISILDFPEGKNGSVSYLMPMFGHQTTSLLLYFNKNKSEDQPTHKTNKQKDKLYLLMERATPLLCKRSHIWGQKERLLHFLQRAATLLKVQKLEIKDYWQPWTQSCESDETGTDICRELEGWERI
jgi:hypothetical protein